MKKKKYQLIVIGAGSAGCTIASEGAKRGLSVVIIERRKKEAIGGKLTCDMIPSYVFDELGIPVPPGEEVDVIVQYLKVFSPDKLYHFEATLGAYRVCRLKFGQRLLGYALDNGAELHGETEFVEPLIEDDTLVGVRCTKAPGKKVFELYGEVICDASGYPGIVRNSLPASVYNNEEINRDDILWKYREVRDIISPSETIPAHDYPGWYCFIQDRGYAWIVPENNGRGNIGCGIPLSSKNNDPEKIIKEYCESNPRHLGPSVYEADTGPIQFLPVRTCLSELVGNRFLVLGDAACQASPVSAFGMASSMIAGKLAAEAAFSAITNHDVSREGLWHYNIHYKRSIGANQAFIDPLRILLQNTPDKHLNIMIKKGLLGPDEFSLVWTDQTFAYSLVDLIKKFLKGFPHISLFLKLLFVYTMSNKLKKHYISFPSSPRDFDGWCEKRKVLYMRLFKKLKIKRTV